MKYVLLMGRGIEGTGNTKYAVEFQEYLENQGHFVTTIANSDKKWGREKSHVNKIKLMSFADEENTITEICKNCDYVFVLSVPAKNYDWFSQDSFYNVICDTVDAGVKCIYIQVDHKRASIARNFYSDYAYIDILEKFDMIFTHSQKCDFIDFCKENGLKTKKMICAKDLGVGEIFGINFDKYMHLWRNEKEDKVIRFMGRSANWKGPWLVRDLHEKFFKSRGYITILEGIEGSIGTVTELYKETKPNRIPREDVIIKLTSSNKKALDSGKINFERYVPTYVLPPYDNVRGMDRLSRSTFGIELLLLDDKVLGDVYEYAMLEMVAVGVVPIFRKRWGEKFTVNGKPIIEQDCGIVFMDENDPTDALDLMDKLSQNKELYNVFRNKALKFFKENFDSKVIFSKILEATNEI